VCESASAERQWIENGSLKIEEWMFRFAERKRGIDLLQDSSMSEINASAEC